MTPIRKIILAVAVACIIMGAVGQWGPPLDWSLPGIEWLWPWSQSGPVECVVVEKTEKRTQEIAAVFNSAEVFKAGEGCKLFRWVDENAKGPNIADVQWALDLAKPKPKPLVCFRRGGKVASTPLPTTPEAMVALLKKNGGK